MKIKRRCFSFILSIVMMASCMTTAVFPVFAADEEDETPVYKDTNFSFEERAADLVSRMTLEEKVSQIGYKAPAIERLGVHDYDYWKEALHGVARQGAATSFPTALSMSNTWNRELIQKMADITSTEARAKNNRYNLSYWSPTVNMARDPRWGRNEETYGEDPYLTGQLGAAFVKGMQGADEKYLKTIATLKHFAANNNEANRSSGSSKMSEFNFRNYYTRVFQNITEDIMPASVMSSYNATTFYRNGELVEEHNFKPSLANSYLLQDLLRRNWGFDGYVTSDCGAGEYLLNNAPFKQALLGNTNSASEAYIAEVFKAGLNVECSLSGGNRSQEFGVRAVENGYLDEGVLDRAVYELFLQRFKTGEFDDEGVPYRNYTAADIETDANVAAAEEIAEESWVLLKNDGMLPLQKNTTKIAVVGNMANKLVLGDYTGKPTKNVTPIEGIKNEFGNDNVQYLGEVLDTEQLFNVKSVVFLLEDGKTRTIDLSKAESVSGMTVSDGKFIGVTPKASAVIKNIDFRNVKKVRVEMSTGSQIGGEFSITYSGGPVVATVPTTVTSSLDEYVVCEADYTGTDGGYAGVSDMIISASPRVLDFSVANYKTQLDAADVIIAYAGTVPKQEGLGTADSSESHDRSSIDLPVSQKHVQEICDAYPDKAVVVMSTVGQINIEPFMNKCKAILWTSYNGQTQGTALGKVLSGEVNPSGRITTTWYKNEDVKKMELAGGEQTIGGIKGRYTNYDIQAEGTNPGHTYQYYAGTPVYPFGYGLSYTDFTYSDMTADKAAVDANGEVTFTVKVTNSGSVKGKEVVQLYVAHPNAGTGNMPKKQLKGFEKVELEPGASTTVSIKLNVRDMYLFDEAEQKDIVPTGVYTAYIGKNADDTALLKTFSVTGTLSSTIKTVKAIPDGIVVTGYIGEDGTGLIADKKVKPNLSVVMSDEQWIDLESADVVYKSSDTDVATVETDGTVLSGTQDGVAVITAEVTVNGETKETSYPVVNKLSVKPSESDFAATKAKLLEARDKMPKAAYSDKNWSKIEKIYSDGLGEIDNILTKSELDIVLARLINEMSSVEMDKLNNVYSLSSENPKHVENGVIDYRLGGIPMYGEATGTVTNVSPYTGIKMQAFDENGNAIDSSDIVWQIKKFDNSVRKVADIDSETGVLTVYGNGIVQVTAADVDSLKCGTMMIHVNMQIEAEYADNGNGANLYDVQGTPSGGYNAGSTGDAWIEYKAVKLSNLDGISLRYAGKNSGTINIRLDKDDKATTIATKSFESTGGWKDWKSGELDINSETLQNAQLEGKFDDYGCATIYVQTNGLNLDYFRMNYIENNDREPYIIEKTMNKTNGRVKVTLKYRGSSLAEDVSLISAVKSFNGKLKTANVKTVKGTGEFEIETGAAAGDNVQIFVWKSLASMIPLAKAKTVSYSEPVDSTIVVYSFDSNATDENGQKGADYTPLGIPGTKNTKYETTINGLCGYGGWAQLENKSSSYTYTDVNEKAYEYTFTKAMKGGGGSSTNTCYFFTPKSDCKVTAVFMASTERVMKIEYDGKTVEKNGVGDKAAASVSFDVKSETGEYKPVYVYGGGSNKWLTAIIVEYYGKGTAAVISPAGNGDGDDRAVQFAKWGNTDVVLTENDVTGETKVWTVMPGDIRVQLYTDYFYESDIPNYNSVNLKMNSIAEYNGRLYAGCDNGLAVIFTDCVKCYKLKKICDIDIKSMSISGDTMYVSDGITDIEINMTDIGGESIEADEAYVLAANGAVLVDVRSVEEFAEKSVDGSVNIPVENIEEGLSAYGRDTALIFYCEAGTRASAAVKAAKAMGFTNVYNLESINKLI